MRRLLLLPLLLLVGCGTPEPKKPSVQEVGQELVAEIHELENEVESIFKKGLATGNPCLNSETAIAGMEMIASKWQSISALQEANGEPANAMKARGLANRFTAMRSKLIRSCR